MGWRTLRARRWLTKVLIYLLAVSVIVFAFKNMESLQYVHRRLQPSVTPVFQAMTEPYEILQQEQQLAGHPLSTMLLNRSKEEQSVLRLDRRLWRPEDLAYQSLPNLPTYYLLHKEPKITEDSCAEYPSLYDLHFNNLNWQEEEPSRTPACLEPLSLA